MAIAVKRGGKVNWLKQAGMLVLLVLGLWSGFELLRVARVPPRLDFSGTTVAGSPWSLADYRGKAPLIVNFYAIYCSGCNQEFPHLAALQKKYQDRGLQVVVVAQDRAEELKELPHLMNAPVTILADGGEVFQKYGINSIPHTILFNRDGSVAMEISGFDTARFEEMEERLKALPTQVATQSMP